MTRWLPPADAAAAPAQALPGFHTTGVAALPAKPASSLTCPNGMVDTGPLVPLQIAPAPRVRRSA